MRKLVLFLFLFAILNIPLKAQINLQKGLVAYFPFNGNTNDISGSKLMSKINGAALTNDVTGKPDGAYYFNGVNAFIEVINSPAINLTDSFTISCWIAPETKGNYKSWLSKANQYSQWRFGFGDVTNKEWGFGSWNKDRSDYFTTNDSIPLNTWSFVAVTFSKISNKIAIYKNGILIESFDIAFGTLGSNNPLYIGYQKDDCTWFNGNIDEIKIFNRSLNSNEISQLYKELSDKMTNPVFINKTITYTSSTGMIEYLSQNPPDNLPVRFAPHIMATNKMENNCPAFSPDGNEIYWSVTRPAKDTTYQEIYFVKKENNKWTEPKKATFSKINSYEGGPVVSSDGKKLYMYRGEPIFRRGIPKNLKILCYSKVNNEWTNPEIITDGWYHTVAKNGTIYFINNNKFLTASLKDGKYSKPDTLKQIAFPTGQCTAPFIAPDESYMIFSLRNSEVNGDLYITFRDPKNQKWTIPAKFENINSTSPESFSSLSPDGKYLFFVRRTPESNQDVFWVSSQVIEQMKKIVFKGK